MHTTAAQVERRSGGPGGPGVRLALAAWLLFAAPAFARGRVVLVVHQSNPSSEVSSAQLRHILLGDETRWPGRQRITILLLPQGSEERTVLLRGLLRMSDDDFTRHWISRVFQGEATAGPKIASTPASMARLVAGIPSAIGMLDADDLPAGTPGLKVLRVDGKAPDEEGYPLVQKAPP
jgi:ABC-type phosphate transport system substrate-binding protein